MSDTAPLDLLVLGDCNPDLVLAAPDLRPAFGQAEVLADSAELTIGGSGSIMACAAARLGCRTALVAVVGEDLFGRFMVDALAERGVDTSGVVVDPAAQTGLTTVLVRDGDRGMVTYPGSIAALTADAVDRDLMRRARHVHVASYFLQSALWPGLQQLAADAHAAGATLSIDPNWDPSGTWDAGLIDLLGSIELLLPNAEEAMRITGHADPMAAAHELSGSGTTVVVKLGRDGALAVRDGVEVRVPALPDTHPVDTIGAGDAFDAGLLAALLDGEPLSEALALACACGALSTGAAGGTAAQPTLEEARAALQERD